ncbi:DUF7244 family protein [Hafnia sp.]|uniref:DUF7244 family protein n=1 Tax=Gammaproteobacteria TaxID=1236 RepID=UPI003FA53E13
MLVKCIRNDSKELPFSVGSTYNAEYIGGLYKISYMTGVYTSDYIQAPLSGHYLEFIPVE